MCGFSAAPSASSDQIRFMIGEWSSERKSPCAYLVENEFERWRNDRLLWLPRNKISKRHESWDLLQSLCYGNVGRRTKVSFLT